MADGSLELSVIKIDPRITWIKDQIVIWLRNLDSDQEFHSMDLNKVWIWVKARKSMHEST